MREALTLLFLIAAYNFLLWYLTFFELIPFPLFPEDPFNLVLVISFSATLYLSWLFGERYRAVQWIGYLFFFQIVALSFYLQDLEIIVRDLPPVVFTLALVSLFESPTEKRLRAVEEEKEELLKEIDKVFRERQAVEIRMDQLRKEMDKLAKEKADLEKENKKEEVEKLKKRLEELSLQLREYKEKESRLVETNRKLFDLLEALGQQEDQGAKGELKALRKERKKLIKEIVQLQEMVDIYAQENEKLREEKERAVEKVAQLEREKNKLEVELENLKKKIEKDDVSNLAETLLGIKVEKRALEEILNLPPSKRTKFVKEIIKFSSKDRWQSLEPLATDKDILKFRFSGGRLYFKRNGQSLTLVGVLDSEDDKDKDRYIKEVLSKI